LWAGHRTRQLDGAHLEFLSGIQNPVGIKIGPDVTPEIVVDLCARLDPQREPGRLTLVSRMGATRIEECLPPLLRAVTRAGHPVVWACDPMHGNTFVHESGYKTRHFDEVMAEVKTFFDACRSEGVWPGGVHVELTGDDVTECLGGAEAIRGEDLAGRYETVCDPRLNARQSLDLAFHLAELVRR
jgi:3-deoxy-7-phosphoheptulonate synthase